MNQSLAVIRVDDERTWPLEVLALLNEKFSVLREHQRERDEAQKLLLIPYLERPRPRPYQHHDEWCDVEKQIKRILSSASLVGYHCTRLCPDEIEAIKSVGLQVTGKELVQERIDRRERAGDISSELAETLMNGHLAESTACDGRGQRKGLVFFVFTENCLREEAGLFRFFSLWGGEMIYWDHADDPMVAGTLGRLGTSCIVEASVPINGLNCFPSIEERLIFKFLETRGVHISHGPDFEGFIESNVPSERILRVIDRSDPEFARLTQCDDWSEPPT